MRCVFRNSAEILMPADLSKVQELRRFFKLRIMKHAYFEPGDRHNVVVEDVADMAAAEQEADRLLSEASSADESGSTFVRIKSSGVKRNDRYYFKAVMVHSADGISH
jgi:hypothetical protein